MNMHNFTRGAAVTPNGAAYLARAFQPMTLAEMQRVAPSAFATDAHDSRSDRYAYIPTVRIIEALQDSGFVPTKAMQSRTRDASRREFTKHMLTFARQDGRELLRVGDSIPQVTLVNSHDGTSAYQLIAGLFRLACSNGLLVAESSAACIRVQHTGDIVGRVLEGSFSVIEDATRAGETSKAWAAIELQPQEQQAFVRSAAALRWESADKAPMYNVQALNVPRRPDDAGADLWSTFNRVQENITKGGQRGKSATGRRQTVRAVQAIDGNVALNRALWSLGEEMARLKAAA